VQPPLVSEALPTLARALKESLIREGEPELAAQLEQARIHALCGCGDRECMSFYVMPPEDERSRPGDYNTLEPDAVIAVDIHKGRMTFIEDLVTRRWDPDTRARLAEYEAVAAVVPRHVQE
jgi:hypothetical protein